MAIAGHGAGDQVAVDGQINVRDTRPRRYAADAILQKIGGLLNAGDQDRLNGAKINIRGSQHCAQAVAVELRGTMDQSRGVCTAGR